MGVYPKGYNKKTFTAFLHKNNVSDKVIKKFNELPQILTLNDSEYELSVDTTWYSDGDTHYNFELNYYSEDIVEYLFSSKVFGDIEVSINYLLCELINNGYSKNDEECKL